MATSPKFSFLQTKHLAGGGTQEVSIQSLIDSSEALAEEAREVLPYSFDECTYSKGYLRQSIWSCVDCGGKGVCYGCSISCHADHRLVELWTKRHFRCDCPTTAMQNGEGSGRTRCTLTSQDQAPQLENEENRYSHNFKGEFCRCGRDYDPETETEAMIHCIGCEDWYHESCLNLRKGGAQPEEDDDDDEAKVLIPSDSYDGLLCAACVNTSEYVTSKAGRDGWMTIEPDGEGYKVVGRLVAPISGETETGAKRERPDEPLSPNKKAKIERENGDMTINAQTGAKADAETETTNAGKGKGDVFLAHGIRERLQDELDAQTITKLPFPLVDEEIYEPPQDEEEDETLDQVTNRVVAGLPRVQAIEALHGYQTMKDKLMGMLRGHVAKGEAVRKEDIEQFFTDLKQGAAR